MSFPTLIVNLLQEVSKNDIPMMAEMMQRATSHDIKGISGRGQIHVVDFQ